MPFEFKQNILQNEKFSANELYFSFIYTQHFKSEHRENQTDLNVNYEYLEPLTNIG